MFLRLLYHPLLLFLPFWFRFFFFFFSYFRRNFVLCSNCLELFFLLPFFAAVTNRFKVNLISWFDVRVFVMYDVQEALFFVDVVNEMNENLEAVFCCFHSTAFGWWEISVETENFTLNFSFSAFWPTTKTKSCFKSFSSLLSSGYRTTFSLFWQWI